MLDEGGFLSPVCIKWTGPMVQLQGACMVMSRCNLGMFQDLKFSLLCSQQHRKHLHRFSECLRVCWSAENRIYMNLSRRWDIPTWPLSYFGQRWTAHHYQGRGPLPSGYFCQCTCFDHASILRQYWTMVEVLGNPDSSEVFILAMFHCSWCECSPRLHAQQVGWRLGSWWTGPKWRCLSRLSSQDEPLAPSHIWVVPYWSWRHVVPPTYRAVESRRFHLCPLETYLWQM